MTLETQCATAAAYFSWKENSKDVFKREKVKQTTSRRKEKKERKPKTKGEQGNVNILELNYSYT